MIVMAPLELTTGILDAMTYKATYAEEAVHEPDPQRRAMMIAQVSAIRGLVESHAGDGCAFPDESLPATARQGIGVMLDDLLASLEKVRLLPYSQIRPETRKAVVTKTRNFISELESLATA